MENLTHHKKHYFNSLMLVIWNTCGSFFLFPCCQLILIWFGNLSYCCKYWALSLTIGEFQSFHHVWGCTIWAILPSGKLGEKTDTHAGMPNVDVDLWKWYTTRQGETYCKLNTLDFYNQDHFYDQNHFDDVIVVLWQSATVSSLSLSSNIYPT